LRLPPTPYGTYLASRTSRLILQHPFEIAQHLLGFPFYAAVHEQHVEQLEQRARRPVGKFALKERRASIRPQFMPITRMGWTNRKDRKGRKGSYIKIFACSALNPNRTLAVPGAESGSQGEGGFRGFGVRLEDMGKGQARC
jgi:hypothetical protein